MFTHIALSTLNGLELMVYNYVIKNKDKVMYMTIRELADAADVSTTTILRFCKKMNCSGYSEFRIRFKLYIEQEEKLLLTSGAVSYTHLVRQRWADYQRRKSINR